MKYKLTLVAILVTICSVSASAQRTMNGQPALRLDAILTDSSFGAEAVFSQYTISGFWEAGVSAKQYATLASSAISISSLNVVAEGDYLFRLVGTRSRSVSLYGGAGAFIGYEVVDPLHRIPGTIQTNLSKGYFLYGLQAKLMAEFFVSRTVALTVDGCVPVNFSSPLRRFHFDVGVGVKIML